MRELLDAVAEHWRQHGVSAAGPVPPDMLLAFEARYGVRLPPSMRAYFATLGGMGADEMDGEMIALWPLERVLTVAAYLGHQEPTPAPADEYFCFADWSIDCQQYAVRLTPEPANPGPVVAVYGGDHLVPAAPDFETFLRGYLANDPDVLFPPVLPGRVPRT